MDPLHPPVYGLPGLLLFSSHPLLDHFFFPQTKSNQAPFPKSIKDSKSSPCFPSLIDRLYAVRGGARDLLELPWQPAEQGQVPRVLRRRRLQPLQRSREDPGVVPCPLPQRRLRLRRRD